MIKGIPVDKPAAFGRNPTALRHEWNHTAHVRGVCKMFHQVSHCSDLCSVVLPRTLCVNIQMPSYLVPMRNVTLQASAITRGGRSSEVRQLLLANAQILCRTESFGRSLHTYNPRYASMCFQNIHPFGETSVSPVSWFSSCIVCFCFWLGLFYF